MRVCAAVHPNPQMDFPKVWAMTDRGFTAWGTKKSINSKTTSNSAKAKYNEKVSEGYIGLGWMDLPSDGAVKDLATFLAEIANVLCRGVTPSLPLRPFSNVSMQDSGDKMLGLIGQLRQSFPTVRPGIVDRIPLPDGRVYLLASGAVVGVAGPVVQAEAPSPTTEKMLLRLVKTDVAADATDTAW